MKKTVLEQAIVFIIAILSTILVFAITGAGLWDIIEAVTDCLIFTAFILMVDDVAFKWLRYRILLCWQYWVGFGLETLTVAFFAFAAKTPSVLWMYLGLVLTLLSGVCVFLWDYKVYNIIDFSEEGLAKTKAELEKKRAEELKPTKDGKPSKASRKELKKMRKLSKRFSKLNADTIKNILYSQARFRFINNSIEADIDLTCPLDSDSLATFNELSIATENQSKARDIKLYIDAIVDSYITKRTSNKEN